MGFAIQREELGGNRSSSAILHMPGAFYGCNAPMYALEYIR